MMHRDEQFDPENVSNAPAGVDADTNIYVTPGAARPVIIKTDNGNEIRPIPGAAPVIIAPVVTPAAPAQPGPGASPIPANAYGTAYNGAAPATPVNGNTQPAQGNSGTSTIQPNGYGTTATTTTSYGQPGQINPGVVSANGQAGQPQQLNPANGYGTVYTGSTTATTSYNGATQPSQGNSPNSRGNSVNQASPMPANAAGSAPGTITMTNYGQPAQANQPQNAVNANGQTATAIPGTITINNYGQPVQGTQSNSTSGQPQSAPAAYNNGFVSRPSPVAATPASGYGSATTSTPNAANPANGYPQPPQGNAPNGPVYAYGQPASGNPASMNANGYGQPASPIPPNSYGTVYSGAPYSPEQAPVSPASSFTAPTQQGQGNGASQQTPYTYNQTGQGYTSNSTATPAQAAQPNGAAYSSTSPNLAPTYIINYGVPGAAQGNPNTENSASRQNSVAPVSDPYGASNTRNDSNAAYGTGSTDASQREARARSADAMVDNSNQENAANNSRYSEPTTTTSTRTTTTTDTNPQDYETARLTRKTTTQQTTTKDMGGSHIEKHTNLNWGGITKGVVAIAAVVIVGVGVYFGAGALTSAAIHSPTFGPMIQGVVDFTTPLLASARDGLSYAAGYLSGVPDIIGGGFRALFGMAPATAATSTTGAASVAAAAPAVAASATVAPAAPSVAANAGIASKMAGWLFGSGAALWVADHSLFPTVENAHLVNHTENLVTTAPVTEIKTTVETIPEVHAHGDHAAHAAGAHADHAAHTAAEMGLQAHELNHIHHANHSHAMANAASHNTHGNHHSDSVQSDASVDMGDVSAPDADVDEAMLKRIEDRGNNWRNRTSGSNHFSESLNKSGSYRTAVESNRNGTKNITPSDSYIADLEAARDALGEPSRV